jgi:hypothetical protein
MKSKSPTIDERDLTELEIGPDGRVYLFGASPEVLRILDRLRVRDDALDGRLRVVEEAASQPQHRIQVQNDHE